MSYSTIISAVDLHNLIDDDNLAVIDCRFTIEGDPELGRKDYWAGHIPGALYAHLDEDFTGQVIPRKTGRHPLPNPRTMTEKISNWGVDSATQVVIYDDTGGSIPASRLWWVFKWLGHDQVAVLDGGWQSWIRKGYEISCNEDKRPARNFLPHIRSEMVATVEDVLVMQKRNHVALFDSRPRERYLGVGISIDPIVGHIPGARSSPSDDNLGPGGCFLSSEEIAKRYKNLLGSIPVEETIFYCGSGIRACHNALALAHSGLGLPRVYIGSWSEWILNPNRPTLVGPDP